MKKITEEELSEIQSIKQEAIASASFLGELMYQQIWLQEQMDVEKEKVLNTKKKERDLFARFREKYGDVVINIETGEFS